MDEGPGLFSLGDILTQRTEVKTGANPWPPITPPPPSRITCWLFFWGGQEQSGGTSHAVLWHSGILFPLSAFTCPSPSYLLKGQQGVGLPTEVHTASEFLTDFSNLWRGGGGGEQRVAGERVFKE